MVKEHLRRENLSQILFDSTDIVPLIPIDSANLTTEHLKEDRALKKLHQTHGPYILLNIKYIRLTKDKPILNVVLVNSVSIKINSFIDVRENCNIYLL